MSSTKEQKKIEAIRAKLGTVVRGKGIPRRKKIINKPKINSRQLLDNLLNQVHTNEVSNVSGIYLLNKDGEADLHFNFPKVNLVSKAFAYVIYGTATKTMKEDSSSSEEEDEPSLAVQNEKEEEEPSLAVQNEKEEEEPSLAVQNEPSLAVQNENEKDETLEKEASLKAEGAIEEVTAQRNPNKWERRFRGMVKKNGIKAKAMPYSSIRFVLKDQNFIVKNAEIDKVGKDAYIVYGRIEIESDDKIAQLAEEFGENIDFSKINMAQDDDEEIPDLVGLEKTETSSAIPEDVKFSETDVAMVMDQTTATREQAIKALTDTAGDMIAAIMNLS